jgi:hypothetical protein
VRCRCVDFRRGRRSLGFLGCFTFGLDDFRLSTSPHAAVALHVECPDVQPSSLSWLELAKRWDDLFDGLLDVENLMIENLQ